MIAQKFPRPISIATQIGLLSLSVAASPLLARADATTESDWVWGVAGRDATNVTADIPLFVTYATGASGFGSGIGPLAVSTGDGVTVAILDTGIDLDHAEFTGRIAAGGTCFGGLSDCTGPAAIGDDDHGHGTHVAGIVAAASDGFGTTGVAYDADLLPVKVLAASGAGSYQAVAQGISYASESGAQVINMSLGGPRPNVTSDYTSLVSALQQAAQTSVIVVAAGNDGNSRSPNYPAAFATQPGIVGSMIIAGALQPNGVGIARFSNTPGTGGCAGPRSARYCFKDVFLVAPGSNILSTIPGGAYGTASGTSMAAPYISGVAALVYSAAPYLTPQEVAAVLFSSAIDLGRPGTDPIYGRGLVNAAGALSPLGVLSVATSGSNTRSRSGTGSLAISQLSGALSYGLRASQAAKDLVFFDAFNRDFRTDLTKSIAHGGVSLGGVVAQTGPALRSVTYAADGLSASALFGEEDGNMVAFGGATGAHVSTVRDAVVVARLNADTSVVVGYNASASGRLNQLDLAASEAFDGLFMSASALNSPYLGFAADASLIGASTEVVDGVALSLGYVSQTPNRDAAFDDEMLTVEEAQALRGIDADHLAALKGSTASLSWRFASWGVAGFNVVYTNEDNALFGGREAGALALTGESQTVSTGAGARINLGNDWVASVSWSAGVSQVTPELGGLFSSVSELRTQAYGAALSRRGIFGVDDAFGFGVSRPLHIVDGSAVITASTGVTKAREIIYTSETINLASATPETDFEFGYTAPLGEGTFFQANAIYQFDLAGVKGSEAVAGLATLKSVW